ncbi:MAG: UDP-N-acetylmuramoyl-L-alanine--D-glutamate ligase [Leptospiraceae bacterium]|nr:UDP-N-acetylmuramoyl-L-alanine--D-glutamate ligase [Leptospiraceae bacterium]
MLPLKIIIENAKRVLVYGGGKTGSSCIEFLQEKGKEVILLDKSPQNLRVPFFLESSDPENLGKIDLVVKSPGIDPKKSELIQKFQQNQIPILSEIDLAYHFFSGKIVGITGTDGKSTTTALTTELLRAEKKVEMGGNIGLPFLEFCEKDLDLAVLELSSYQLEDSNYLRVNFPTILNIANDHLERHGTMENYILAKSKIATEAEIVILNDRQKDLFLHLENKKLFFGFHENSDAFININDKTIITKQNKYSFERFSLFGNHNLENLASAILLAELTNVSSKCIQTGIDGFSGLAHRFQKFLEYKNSIFINDSKSTNSHSMLSGLSSFTKNSNLTIILGGIPKEEPTQAMFQRLKELEAKVYLYGEAVKYWETDLGAMIGNQLIIKRTIAEIVEDIFRNLEDTKQFIILSPACASLDQYKNFEERGNDFMNLVKIFTNE